MHKHAVVLCVQSILQCLGVLEVLVIPHPYVDLDEISRCERPTSDHSLTGEHCPRGTQRQSPTQPACILLATFRSGECATCHVMELTDIVYESSYLDTNDQGIESASIQESAKGPTDMIIRLCPNTIKVATWNPRSKSRSWLTSYMGRSRVLKYRRIIARHVYLFAP